MKKSITKLFAVLLSVMMIFTMLPLNGYAETTTPEKVVAKLNNRGFKQVADLGPAASAAVIISAVYGKESGRDVVYTTATGGKFNAIDVKDNKLLFSAQLEGVNQVWSHSIAPDGTVYIVALGANNVGELWSYTPSTKTVKKIGQVEASGQQTWSSTVDSAGNVYIGTYGGRTSDNKIIPGKIIKYSPSTGTFTDLLGIDSECDYVRSLAYHDGYVYAGLGVAGKVYRINVTSGVKENITKNVADIVGKSIADIQFCYDMAVVGNKYLFAKFDNGVEYALLFYDLEKQQWLNNKLAKPHDGSADDYGVFGYTQIPEYNNKAYVSYKRQIQEIDLIALGEATTSGAITTTTGGSITTASGTVVTRATGIKYGAGWRGAAFVNLGTEAAPDMALSTLKGDGTIFYVKNIDTATDSDKVVLPCVVQAAPITLHDLGKGPDGNLYMTTYPGGPRGAKYDTRTGTFVSYAHGQAEGMIAGNGKDMYFGLYPGAVIQKMNTDTLALETLFNLKDTYEQDRPYIMQFTDNKLFIGTIPDYGKLGGTLTIYDTLSGDKKIYRNVIQDQSVVGIAYKDNKIYGSTTILGGLGSTPTAAKAEMFVWDVATEKVIKEIDLTSLLTDLDKPPMISGLTLGKDGLLWGAVDGYIFAMNPDTYQIVKSKNIYPNIKNRGMWRPVHILWGEDGLLYTDVGGKLTVMDPSNLNYVTVIGSGAEVDWIALAKDSSGNENIYFLENGTTNLKMVPVIEGGEVEQPPVEPTIVNVPIFNSSLEEPVVNGVIPGWTSLFANITANVSFGVSNEKSTTGGNSLKIVDKATNETVFVQSDLIPVMEGVEYTGSVQLYLEDNMASFFLRYFDESGKQVGADKDGVNIIHVRSGFKQWQTVKATVMAPAGAKYARLFVGDSNYFTTNGAYFDDFKLTYVGDVKQSVAPGTLIPYSQAQVEQGKEFDVAIRYFGSETKDLYAFKALLNYDSTKLELVSVQKAGSFDTASSAMQYTTTPGAIQIVTSQTGENFTCENGDVIVLKFKALDVLGKTQITLGKGTKMATLDSQVEYSLGMDKSITIDIIEYYGIPEDIDKDEDVDLNDVVGVARNVGVQKTDSNKRLDVNGDGVIDISDVGLVMLKYLELGY